jgi:hypothetical protein
MSKYDRACQVCPTPVGPKGAKGFCPKHYHVYRNHGDPLWVKPEVSALDRFMERVDKNGPTPDATLDPLIRLKDPTPCWIWTSTVGGYGYGYYSFGGRKNLIQGMAHRFSWKLLVGDLREDQKLDHLCRNRKCVNPDHLEPVTNRENILRGASPSASHAKKTHCPSGHEYNQENTYWYRNMRQCKICRRTHSANSYRRRTDTIT